MHRRTVIAGTVTTLAALSGCTAPKSTKLAHTVTVYLGDREATRDVSVTVESADGDTLFERDYTLSDDNEAHEDATFPASTTPVTVRVSIDGTEFARPWPSEPVAEACTGNNRRGVELWIEGRPDDDASLRLESNCQYHTVKS